MKTYTLKAVAELYAIDPTDIRRLAIKYRKGKKINNAWVFSFDDAMFFATLIDYQKYPRKDDSVESIRKYFSWPKKQHTPRKRNRH